MESETKLSFAMLSDCLCCGREIEFSFRGKQYSITNSQGVWNFCCDSDGSLLECICPFKDKDALICYVKTCSIDGVLIPEIFDQGLYDGTSVCIL